MGTSEFNAGDGLRWTGILSRGSSRNTPRNTPTLLVFKVLNGLGPLYLSELLRPHIPTRNLRSSKKKLLIVPKCNLKTYGCRAFSHRAPTLWNALPNDIRQVELLETFKSKLKTHLFRQFFH